MRKIRPRQLAKGHTVSKCGPIFGTHALTTMPYIKQYRNIFINNNNNSFYYILSTSNMPLDTLHILFNLHNNFMR